MSRSCIPECPPDLVVTTRAIDKTLNPRFNQTLELPVSASAPPSCITIEVWDKDTDGKDFLGEATVRLADVLGEDWLTSKPRVTMYELRDPHRRLQSRVSTQALMHRLAALDDDDKDEHGPVLGLITLQLSFQASDADEQAEKKMAEKLMEEAGTQNLVVFKLKSDKKVSDMNAFTLDELKSAIMVQLPPDAVERVDLSDGIVVKVGFKAGESGAMQVLAKQLGAGTWSVVFRGEALRANPEFFCPTSTTPPFEKMVRTVQCHCPDLSRPSPGVLVAVVVMVLAACCWYCAAGVIDELIADVSNSTHAAMEASDATVTLFTGGVGAAVIAAIGGTVVLLSSTKPTLDRTRLMIYSSDTPDIDDFASMICCQKARYEFETDGAETIMEIIRDAVAANAGQPLKSIALACHGPPPDADGDPDDTAISSPGSGQKPQADSKMIQKLGAVFRAHNVSTMRLMFPREK